MEHHYTSTHTTTKNKIVHSSEKHGMTKKAEQTPLVIPATVAKHLYTLTARNCAST
ncbi:Hypothetical protein PYTT_0743 [Akkermansia glycaniphila]|uniref:Uncharacterized protein n=1 Tax=Akkermansia glycaniphila TaxID=1679444 RepID=A0A1H6L3I5_9BACT|nr:Hypothetical protein PYTT_0743 [Akkermansia glycaniphila]